jgi:hypothetical protein
MEYVCDAQEGRTWFRIESEAEAQTESELMRHAVEKYFRREREAALKSYSPPQPLSIERDIGLKAHIAHAMPIFLTLRDREGNPVATAMLPPGGKDDAMFRIIIVGPANGDPYPSHGGSIELLGKHFGLVLDRGRCFPYGGN